MIYSSIVKNRNDKDIFKPKNKFIDANGVYVPTIIATYEDNSKKVFSGRYYHLDLIKSQNKDKVISLDFYNSSSMDANFRGVCKNVRKISFYNCVSGSSSMQADTEIFINSCYRLDISKIVSEKFVINKCSQVKITDTLIENSNKVTMTNVELIEVDFNQLDRAAALIKKAKPMGLIVNDIPNLSPTKEAMVDFLNELFNRPYLSSVRVIRTYLRNSLYGFYDTDTNIGGLRVIGSKNQHIIGIKGNFDIEKVWYLFSCCHLTDTIFLDLEWIAQPIRKIEPIALFTYPKKILLPKLKGFRREYSQLDTFLCEVNKNVDFLDISSLSLKYCPIDKFNRVMSNANGIKKIRCKREVQRALVAKFREALSKNPADTNLPDPSNITWEYSD